MMRARGKREAAGEGREGREKTRVFLCVGFKCREGLAHPAPGREGGSGRERAGGGRGGMTRRSKESISVIMRNKTKTKAKRKRRKKSSVCGVCVCVDGKRKVERRPL